MLSSHDLLLVDVVVPAGGDQQGEGAAVGPQHGPEAVWRGSPGPVSGRGKPFSFSNLYPATTRSGLLNTNYSTSRVDRGDHFLLGSYLCKKKTLRRKNLFFV